jgi:hypothetical protein
MESNSLHRVSTRVFSRFRPQSNLSDLYMLVGDGQLDLPCRIDVHVIVASVVSNLQRFNGNTFLRSKIPMS